MPSLLRQCCIFLLLLALAASTGCFGSKKITLSTEELEAFRGISPADALSLVKGSYEDSVSENYDFFAPYNLAQGNKALKEAQRLINKKRPEAEILQQTVMAKKRLAMASATKATVLDLLTEAFDAKKYIDDMEGKKIFPVRYKESVQMITKAIALVEKNDMKAATSQRNKLNAHIKALEKDTVIHIALSPIWKKMKALEEDDVDDWAEKTHAKTKKIITASTNFMAANYRDTAGVERERLKASFAADRLRIVRTESERLENKMDEDPEAVALELEAHLHNIANALSLEDQRDKALADQAQVIMKAAGDASAIQGQPDAEQ